MSRSAHANAPRRSNDQEARSRSILAIPVPIKQLFDRFPLLTYPVNELPQRATRPRNVHILYVFTTEDEALCGAPSYNPACLKWQAYLKFSSIPFRIAPANNHASPSGALPFLLPSSSELQKESTAAAAVVAAKLQTWATKHSAKVMNEPGDWRYEAYLSLLHHRIRRAWLYSLYLSPNAASIAEPLYILPASSNPFVRLTLARQLRRAAEKELLNFSTIIDPETLYGQADEAFAALDALLGNNNWFFGSSSPGLFDASVFAYTHLLLYDGLGKGWIDLRLRNALLLHSRLIAHRDRILEDYFREAS